jgi:localization factor PodJL
MATNSPWSVKGVDPEAREAAKIDARKQGVNVGRWLSQTILAAASEELRSKRGHDESLDDGVRAAASSHAEPVRESPGVNGGTTGGPPALAPEAVLESIHKLATRIEESEHRTSETIRPIAEKVNELGSQIDDMKSRTGASTAPVERAMMRLSERLDRIEDTDKGAQARPSRTSDSGSGLLGRLFGRD